MELKDLVVAQHEWHHTRNGECLVDANGKILGEVSSALGGGYYAEADRKSLGKYISSAAAKRAVEVAV